MAVVSIVMVAAVSCSSDPASRKVAVIGDSITWLSSTDITNGLVADHDQPLVTGRIGYTAAQLGGDVATFARQDPQIVLFELGTNDVTESVTGATSAAAYERVMSSYQRDFPHACLIATTVSSHRPSAAMNQTAVTMNAWLKAHFTHVVDWDTYEWAHRQHGDSLVDGDLVHPNPAGQHDLAQLDMTAVKAC